jgi:copper chaperone CopZ
MRSRRRSRGRLPSSLHRTPTSRGSIPAGSEEGDGGEPRAAADKAETTRVSEVLFEGVRMRCDGCRAVVEDELKEVEGIYRTEVDVKGQCVRVLYNPAQTGLDPLQSAVERAGYKPRSHTVVDHG